MEESSYNNHNEQQPEQENPQGLASGELEQCKVALEEWKNKFLRTQADFDNFTRRIEREKITWLRFGQAALLKDLLPIVDNIDRALASQVTTEEPQQLLTGFELIRKEFHKFLTANGVEEIKQMATFDPQLHEALMQVESPDHKPGTIVQVLEKGYQFKGEVLRPAKVSVAQ